MAASHTVTSQDNFPAAAIRHFHDAEILKNANSHENALCHYAFSVECAQKTLLYWRNRGNAHGHDLDTRWNDKTQSLVEAWATLDGSVSAALPTGGIPTKLNEEHPHRRYYKSFPCSQQELEDCQHFAEKMQQTIICMMIDGLITDKGGYEP